MQCRSDLLHLPQAGAGRCQVPLKLLGVIGEPSNPDQTVLLKSLLDHFSAYFKPSSKGISELTSLLAAGDSRRWLPACLRRGWPSGRWATSSGPAGTRAAARVGEPGEREQAEGDVAVARGVEAYGGDQGCADGHVCP